MTDRTPVAVGPLVFDVVAAGPADGPLVLLLHGFPQSADAWGAVLPRLAAEGFRAVAPDQRGYSPGARPVEVEAYALPHLVGDVLGLLDALGADRAHLVGHDWGAAVAWQVAARCPARVRTLTAVSVPHPVALATAMSSDPDQQHRSRYMRGFRVPGEAERALLGDDPAPEWFAGLAGDAHVRRYLERMREPGRLTAALNWYRAARREDVADVPPVAVPTLYVWSDRDAALGRTAAEAAQRFVAGPYRFVELPGVSHWIPEEAPEALLAALLQHLRAHAGLPAAG